VVSNNITPEMVNTGY